MKNLKTRFSQDHAFLVTTLMYSQSDIIYLKMNFEIIL